MTQLLQLNWRALGIKHSVQFCPSSLIVLSVNPLLQLRESGKQFTMFYQMLINNVKHSCKCNHCLYTQNPHMPAIADCLSLERWTRWFTDFSGDSSVRVPDRGIFKHLLEHKLIICNDSIERFWFDWEHSTKTRDSMQISSWGTLKISMLNWQMLNLQYGHANEMKNTPVIKMIYAQCNVCFYRRSLEFHDHI